MKIRSRGAIALLAGSSTFAMVSLAGAQTVSKTDELQEIVVTGSRVITNGNASPTPVTVVSVDDILASQPTTISEALNTMPQFSGSQTSTSGPGSGIRNGSAAYINLRNAGDNHTLVLYDGHRVLPAAPQESHASDVDINLIPQILLKRVDIVTGGTSAVYGADAITGVVNFITDTEFTGIKVNTSAGVSTYDEDWTKDAAIAFGSKLFGERGHVLFSYEYRDDPGILDPQDKYQRPFLAAVYGGSGNGTAASPYTRIENARLSNTSFGGKIVSATGSIAALNNINFTQNGVLTPFVNGTPVVGNANVQSGGDGAYYYNSSIKTSLRYDKLFGRFDYDLTDTTHGYLQYGWTNQRSKNYYQSANVSFNVGLNNPFLDTASMQSSSLTTAQFQALRSANPNASFRMTKFMLNQESAPIENEMDFGMLLGGVDGSIGEYKWQVGFGHSWADQDIRNPANMDMGRLFAAVDTVRDSSGNIVCRAASVNAAYSGCVPLNVFGPTSESAAALEYITFESQAKTHVELDEVQTSITGAPFSSWAGPIGMAASAEWHSTGYNLVSNAAPGDTVDCNGIRFGTLTGAAVTGNCNGPNTNNPTIRWAQNTLTPLNPGVSVETFEGALEADIPLLKDVRFANDLDVNLAARYTDFSTGDPEWTWKVGLNWQMNDEWRFRATRSHDIRAPNLYELYSPPAVNITNFNDFVVNGVGTTQSGTVPLVGESDPNMKPEQADTATLGVVYVSSNLPGFSVSLDAYRIKMSDTIFQIRAIDQYVIDTCVNSGGTHPYCSWYVRPTPTSFPTKILRFNMNIASQDTYGVDLETNYGTRVWGRALNLRALVNWQPHNIFNTGMGGVVDVGGAYTGGPAAVGPSPYVRANIMAKFDFTDNFSATVMTRWRSAMKPTGTTSPTPTAVYAVDEVPSVAYTNLTLSYTIRRNDMDLEVFGNIQNLFNKFADVPVGGAPSTTPGRGISPMAIGDDPIGRYYVMGVRLRM